jgi:2-keto-4-pentenoate hydratase/2-oxohepta-3-ene-1,7-dioic acid hydratase in catechol pathway
MWSPMRRSLPLELHAWGLSCQPHLVMAMIDRRVAEGHSLGSMARQSTGDRSQEVPMRLVTVLAAGQPRLGALLDDSVVDLNRADPALPADALALLQGGPPLLDRARRALGSAISERGAALPLAGVKLLAPIPRPPKIVCIGLNYADHAEEAELAIPARPSVFLKAPSTVIGPGEPIVRPPTTEQLDYEIELAVVIGQRAKLVPRERAMGCVAGYTILNDVSARDLQFAKDGGIILGKNFDTASPTGPSLVLTDEVPDPTTLRLRTWVNGQLRQDGDARNLIFDIPAIISFLSRQLTLEPGDVIATGTPAGVGLGMKPQSWLQPGDTVRMEIDGIGTLENPIVAA